MTGPRPRSDDDHAHWDQASLAYDVLHERAALIARLVVARSPNKLLELGCSTGQLACELRRQLPTLEYFGTDISHAALERNPVGTVAVADINTDGLPFADHKFDSIVASGVLEYVDDLDRLFSDLHARLPDGGFLVASYVNRQHPARVLRRAAGRGVGDRTWRPLVTLDELLGLAEHAGFEVDEMHRVRGRLAPTDTTDRAPRTVSRQDAGVLFRIRARQFVIVWRSTAANRTR